jgi:glycine/D-amino acid oxidase-like deaminating enzyme
MGPPVDPVEPDPDLPARCAVVVIGGGIIGTCTALFLAEQGVPVVLCEKGEIAGEQSSRNWGWVRKTGRDPREIPLIIESLRLWQGMNERVEGETGFRVTGVFFASTDPAELAQHEAWLEHARPYQLDTHLLGPAEAAALFPGSTLALAGGLLTPSDGRAEPQKAAPAIAAAARRHGARVLTRCAVRAIETAGGRVSGMVTERGPIACESIVLAGGAWSGLFCAGLGLRLPQLKVLSSVLRTAPLAGAPEMALYTPRFAFRKRLDGGYNIANAHATIAPIVPDSFRYAVDFLPILRDSWRSLHFRLGERFIEEWRTPRRLAADRPSVFERVRILDPRPAETLTRQALAELARALPAFAGARIAQHWAGLIDVTPDAVPVISPVEALPGFFIATGFSGHGFGIGTGAGRLMADLVMGRPPIVDPSPFRFSRFSDGSNPRPIAGL